MITDLRIEGYRSVRNLYVEPSELTVIVGANGTGKTNIYRALELIRASAMGTLHRDLASEGGMPSALWAGSPWRTSDEADRFARSKKGKSRISLSVSLDHLTYSLAIGLPNPISDPALPLDPVIREERVTARAGQRSVTMMERKGPAIFHRNASGRMTEAATDLLMSETALGNPMEPDTAGEVMLLQSAIRRWRFYHQFRTDTASPLRQPQTAITSPELDSDGGNWTSVMMTAAELGDGVDVATEIDAAFPGAAINFQRNGGRAEAELTLPEFQRPFSAGELSDGTLRYLCLVAALAPYRLPPFLALNEPETSLHPSLIPPLAHLIGRASRETQVLIVTHSSELADILDLDFAATVLHLEKDRGETRIS